MDLMLFSPLRFDLSSIGAFMMKGVEVYFSNIIIIVVFLLVVFNSNVCQ